MTFALIQSPSGMTVDEFGRISWKPNADNIGNHPVSVKVTDTFGESVTVSYNLSVVADTSAPKVNLIASNNNVNLGDSVIFTVNAVDNVKIESLGLTINGTPVVIDAQGKATVKLNNLTPITAIATAKDAAGNVGNATQVVRAIDTTDVNAPIININLADDVDVSAPLVIRGTITDSNLDYYTLSVAPIATFDPTILANGAYVLKFTAFDANGNGSTTERTVNVAGDLKLGNFRLSFTDLSVPVAGIPINVTRTYDSLNANSSDDFGYGWRMEFRDTDLKTSLKADPTYEELGINTVPFDSKTKVFITLPGGKRETFTFKPTSHHLNQYLGGAGPGAAMYKPAFESHSGSTMTLTVKDANLVRNEYGEYYGVNGQPFNPENPAFGGVYVLTTKEGLVYEIDAKSGDLLTATDANGNKLSFSDAGIKSSTGKSVTFERDVVGRIVGVVDPDGQKVKYEYDSKGDLVAVKDRENNTTSFKYEAANNPHFLTEVIDSLGRTGVKTGYDDSGRLKQMIDANGSAVELVYDPNNSLQKVKDVFGKETTYVYDSRGNVLTEIDPLGKRIDRTFDGDNNVLTSTVFTAETGLNGWTTEWSYDAKGNKLSEKNALGNVTRYSYNQFGQIQTKTNPLGRTITYKYDNRGNLLSTDNSLGITKQTYDRLGNITAIIDAQGRETKFEYDSVGRVTRQIDALGNSTTYTYDASGKTLTETTTFATTNGSRTLIKRWTYDGEGRVTSETDPLGNVIQYEYDRLGNMTALIEKGMNNRRTEYRYDAKGQLEQTLYADGTSVRSIYDAAGREIATIDQKGQTTHFVYDALDRLIETIYPDNTPSDLSDNPRTKTEYDKIGRIKASIDKRGNRIEYEYDKAGRPILIRDALNNETKYTYDAAGNRLTATDARNQTTKFVYDALGRQAETHFADGTRNITTYDAVGRRSSFTDQTGHTTYFVYDALNRPVEVIHPDDTPLDLSNNPRTKTEYNELGWVTARIDELGNRQEYEYDAKGRLIESRSDCACRRKTYTYDAFGNQISETDQLGRTTSFVYDKLNRLVETRFHDRSYTTTTYDELGRVKTQTDQAGKTTEFEYDALNRLSAVVDALQQRTEYKYDDSGNLIQAKDANQHITQYEYDKLNRRTATILPLGQRSDTTYDPVGNIASTTDFNRNIITYEYDKLNRAIAKRFPDSTAVEYTYTPMGQIKTTKDQRGITAYDYDVRERLISRIDPDNQFIRYRYDAASNRTEVITPTGTTKYTYGKYNQLETVTDPNLGLTRYTYDKIGNLVRTVLPNSTVETRQYNDLNRLVLLENTGLSGVISSYRYTLDPVGNRKVVEEHDGRKVEYNYDPLYRLTQEKITDPAASNRTIDYTYDPVGNRLSSNDSVTGMTNYTYNNNDRLLSDGSNSYTYDNNGNTLSRIKDATDRVVYNWDYENRLIGANITRPTGTVQTQYKYNPDHIRVATTVNGQETRYLIDANQPYAQVLEEYAPGGAVQTSYVYGNDLISQNRGGVRSFYHVDGLGSTRALTNASSTVTDTYDYEAYGSLLGSVGNTVNNYRFAGEQFDPYLGDYYLRRRYYDSDSGRFTTTDPFEGWLEEPLSRAKYPYVHGNPVNAIDPTGLFLQDSGAAMSISSILSTFQYLSPYVGAAGAGLVFSSGSSRIRSLPSPVAIAITTQCALNNDPECRTGLPIVVYAAGNLEDHAKHINDAQKGFGNVRIQEQRSLLPAVLTRGLPQRTNPPWYEDTVYCDDDARDAYQSTFFRRPACDEYPFDSTNEGGPGNYNLNRVSLKFVDLGESNRQGQLMRAFYREANIRVTDSFGVITLPEQRINSYWIDRNGVIGRP
ncbi:MAG: hypothetical protein JGK25_31040 [Microcoleus sp. PH2017_18_LLB_O_A]|nr:hypothetical protein [Microcoleus sp. PH2017_18_LLB_O_A]